MSMEHWDMTQPDSEGLCYGDCQKMLAERDSLREENARLQGELAALREAHDPIAKLALYNRRRDAFVKAYPRMSCPSCRKRVSPLGDSINAATDEEPVRMICGHCDHRWTVERVLA